MILYALKSIVLLSVLAGFYRLLLKNQPLHRFKRVYLLAGLLLAVVGPLLSFDFQTQFVPADLSSFTSQFKQPLHTSLVSLSPATSTNDWPDIRWLVYGFITSVLLIRLVRNLFVLFHRIHQYPTCRYDRATVVLLSDVVQPHTFLYYLFVNQTDYEKKRIEPELFTHELAHIRQYHSLDILFAELMLCFCWFNPILFLVRHTIRLNHEFLADASVNAAHQDVIRYQQVLLSKITPATPDFLTSAFTFQTTKQRFIMMTKRTSPLRAGFTIGMAVTLFLSLTLISSLQSVAQLKPLAPSISTSTKASTQPDPTSLEQRFSDKLVRTRTSSNSGEPGRVTYKKFSELSEAEKKKVVFLAPQEVKTPTEKQFNDWKNPKMYGIWLDDKHIKNHILDNYQVDDIVTFSSSYVHKNARQPQGYLYQINLMTHDGYKRYLARKAESPFLFVADREPVSR